MNEKHKCLVCEEIISIYRVFCSKDCKEKFFIKYPEEEK